uniref:Rap-GAP domain-containing protein n=1 Tax=Panagrellus redivivus TaxID=6233 RepID=A0A7E4VIK5_PANRE
MKKTSFAGFPTPPSAGTASYVAKKKVSVFVGRGTRPSIDEGKEVPPGSPSPVDSGSSRRRTMFARKPKSSDVQTSLQRFSDLNRDASSRAKHFRLALESLCVQERRQLIDDYGFETFHLVDSLLMQAETAVDGGNVADVELALWALEQLLCLAPELIGKGWQKNAIENILKRALLPNNLIAVRKIGIRLFILWYQSLAMFNNSSQDLDRVFQCLLPFFPLHDGASTERVLQEYCESYSGLRKSGNGDSRSDSGIGFNPMPIRRTPILLNPQASTTPSLRERAQLLQVYLDKFLDYCHRETVKIEWNDPGKQLECAKFLLDRVIVLYIYQVFPDFEENGVDVFEGWEGSEEPGEQMDTADPIVIARYWLIRWITNIAAASVVESPAPGQLIFRQALFSSQKAINTLLTLMREAMQLPLACASVIHKVLYVIRHWLLQIEFPPFVEAGAVSIEASSLLLIHICTGFFSSPYLSSSGDRLASAVSVTHSILQISRDLANPSAIALPRPLPKSVWCELIKRTTEAVALCCSRSDAFGRATAGGFTNTLLSICVFIRAIREVEIEEKMWDDVWAVFKTGFWQQMVHQWSKVVDNVTRALILNLFAIDIHEKGADDGSTVPAITAPSGSVSSAKEAPKSHNERLASSRSDKSSDTGSVNYERHNSDDETNVEASNGTTDKDMQSVVQSTGNTTNWLRVWMRIVNLVDPAEPQHSQQAVQTVSHAIDTLLSIGCAQKLVHWLADKLLRLNVAQQPHAIPALCSVLIKAEPPPEQRAHILWHLIECLKADVSPIVLEQLPFMGVEDTAILASPTIDALQRLMRNSEFSSKAVKVAALLALDHPEAEKILLQILETRNIEFDIGSLTLCINALSILVLERADAQLFDDLLRTISQHASASQLIPVLCANLASSVRLGFHNRLVEALELGLEAPRDGRVLNDLKWQLCALSVADKPRASWKALLSQIHAHGDVFLEGLLISKALQYPLPGFPITQWNSIERPLAAMDPAALKAYLKSTVFITTPGALISFEKPAMEKTGHGSTGEVCLTTRTVVGRHAWSVQSEVVPRSRPSHANDWLQGLRRQKPQTFAEARQNSTRKQAPPPARELIDPFQALPSFSSAMSPSERAAQAQASMDMLAFIRRSGRKAVTANQASSLHPLPNENEVVPGLRTATSLQAWRKLAADLNLIKSTHSAQDHFARELRHLDSTLCREVHKVAVIYVGDGQEDKASILANTTGSSHFDYFVEGLGWPVTMGPNHLGYAGGLPAGQTAPYYATADTELVFHVSTQLAGDAQMKMKHIGNDEVHVVWCESRRPYHRDIIATRFCDVLIVLTPVSPVLVRVHVETQNPTYEFGPLFDGVYLHTKQVASLVRDTVINASKAYRLANHDCDRPNKLRESVFASTRSHLRELPVAAAITQLYVPLMRS